MSSSLPCSLWKNSFIWLRSFSSISILITPLKILCVSWKIQDFLIIYSIDDSEKFYKRQGTLKKCRSRNHLILSVMGILVKLFLNRQKFVHKINPLSFHKFGFRIENFKFFYYLYGNAKSGEVIVWNMVMPEHRQTQISRIQAGRKGR